MVREKENNNLMSANIKKNLNVIKAYFEKKNAICQNIEENIYEYTYEDKFRSTDIKIACYFNLKKEKALIRISSSFKEDESIYEIENLFNRIFSELFQILLEGDEKYVVRIYGSYFLEKPIQFHNSFKWKNNLNLCTHMIQGRECTYNVERLTVCPKEQILYCDIEVNAYNLSAARSMAYNLFLEFTTLLSVLLDVGIQPFTSKENIVLIDVCEGSNSFKFYEMPGSGGIYDTQLDIFIFDNMNGVIGIKDLGELVANEYTYISTNDIVLTKSFYNEILDQKFKKNNLQKIKNVCRKGEIDESISFYNTNLELISEHIGFYRKVIRYECEHKKEYAYFYNACKLYNAAHCMNTQSATVMLSYLVASIETLAKVENNEEYTKNKSDMEKFLVFCEKYYEDECESFDKDFVKYLYGNIRSGHFHAGEFSFMEYECNFDLSMDSDFFGMQDIFIRARILLRRIFIKWIKKNILSYDEEKN